MWLTAILAALIFMFLLLSCGRRERLPPGPRGLPVFGSLLHTLKDPFRKLREFAEHYGPVYTLKIGPMQFIMLSDITSIHEAFSKRTDEFNGRPQLMAEATGLGRKGIVLLSPGNYHKHQKKTTRLLLRELGVGTSRFDESIKPYLQQLLTQFGDTTKVVNIKTISSTMMSDIIGALTFGQSLYKGNTDTSLQVRNLISENFQSNPVMIMAGKFLPLFAKQFLSNFVDMETNIAKMMRMMKRLIRSHYDMDRFDDGDQCFVAKYIREYAKSHDGQMLDKDHEEERQLGAIVIDFFQAGCETTDIYLRWVLLLLAANPEVQRKAQAELDSVFGEEPPTLKERSKLPYITAILYEALRVRPPAPLGAPHCTTVDVPFRGYTLPADTPLLTDLLTAHFNPKDFPDPDLFKPERFLNEKNQLTSLKDVLAFGAGQRVCVGEQLAKSISMSCIMNILYRYDLQSKDDREVDLSYKGGVNLFPIENHIKVCPRRRVKELDG